MAYDDRPISREVIDEALARKAIIIASDNDCAYIIIDGRWLCYQVKDSDEVYDMNLVIREASRNDIVNMVYDSLEDLRTAPEEDIEWKEIHDYLKDRVSDRL